MKLGSIALAAAMALAPAAGMAATAPENPASPVGASVLSQFERGDAAYNLGDYATAYRLWRPLADLGNADAQFNIGLMYEEGNGMAQDYAAAVKWYRKAAKQGNTLAQFFMAENLRLGMGVKQDFALAFRWYRKAAEQGDLPPNKWTGLSRSALGLGWADVAQG